MSTVEEEATASVAGGRRLPGSAGRARGRRASERQREPVPRKPTTTTPPSNHRLLSRPRQRESFFSLLHPLLQTCGSRWARNRPGCGSSGDVGSAGELGEGRADGPLPSSPPHWWGSARPGTRGAPTHTRVVRRRPSSREAEPAWPGRLDGCRLRARATTSLRTRWDRAAREKGERAGRPAPCHDPPPALSPPPLPPPPARPPAPALSRAGGDEAAARPLKPARAAGP